MDFMEMSYELVTNMYLLVKKNVLANHNSLNEINLMYYGAHERDLEALLITAACISHVYSRTRSMTEETKIALQRLFAEARKIAKEAELEEFLLEG